MTRPWIIPTGYRAVINYHAMLRNHFLFLALMLPGTFSRMDAQTLCLYTENDEGELVKMNAAGDFNPDYPKTNGTLFSGGGGLSSTAYEFGIFMQMLLNGGTYNGVRLLSRSRVDMMNVNHIGELGSGSLFIPGGTDKFGLGFEVISPPGAAGIPIKEGAYGWGGAFGSLYWVDPEEDLVAQLVIQKTNNYADVRAKFIAAVCQAIDD